MQHEILPYDHTNTQAELDQLKAMDHEMLQRSVDSVTESLAYQLNRAQMTASEGDRKASTESGEPIPARLYDPVTDSLTEITAREDRRSGHMVFYATERSTGIEDSWTENVKRRSIGVDIETGEVVKGRAGSAANLEEWNTVLLRSQPVSEDAFKYGIRAFNNDRARKEGTLPENSEDNYGPRIMGARSRLMKEAGTSYEAEYNTPGVDENNVDRKDIKVRRDYHKASVVAGSVALAGVVGGSVYGLAGFMNFHPTDDEINGTNFPSSEYYNQDPSHYDSKGVRMPLHTETDADGNESSTVTVEQLPRAVQVEDLPGVDAHSSDEGWQPTPFPVAPQPPGGHKIAPPPL